MSNLEQSAPKPPQAQPNLTDLIAAGILMDRIARPGALEKLSMHQLMVMAQALTKEIQARQAPAGES